MVAWHHRLYGREFEQAPGGGEERGSLACCTAWGRQESDMTQQLNNNNIKVVAICRGSDKPIHFQRLFVTSFFGREI